MRESSANNAIVEALASGTVPVVNRIGGVPDYGGDSVYPTCDVALAETFLSRIGHWFEFPDELRAVSRACRDFAVQRLEWSHIRRQHAELYRELWRA